MKLYAPKYYKNFVCIADKCNHSCCIGWEIDVDDKTIEKYASLEHPYGNEIRNSINSCNTNHFILCENDRCPHLDATNLCKIIKNVGEDYLCDICREHPRFYNFTNRGKELGIGISCEEACRIILENDNYDEFDVIDQNDELEDVCEFDAIDHRNYIFAILKDHSLLITDKIRKICDDYALTLESQPIKAILHSLEYLDEKHKDIILSWDKCYINDNLTDKLTRLLAYFIYRHCSEAIELVDFRLSLGLACSLTILISTIAKTDDEIEDVARIVSEEIEYSEENTIAIKNMFE